MSASPYVVSFNVDRGRKDEFDKTEAGNGTVTLSARDGTFDPTKAGSYAAKPLRQFAINIAHPFTGVGETVFSGYTEGASYKRRGPRDGYTELTITDGFELLEAAHVPVPDPPSERGCLYAAAHVDDRIKAALADANWPAARTAVATGNVEVQTVMYDPGTSCLEVIQEAADAEFPGVANFFINRKGVATFNGRGIRFTATPETTYPNKVKRWRVGDSGACAADNTLLPIFDMDGIGPSKDMIYNFVVAGPRGAEHRHLVGQKVRDSISIVNYGRRRLELLDLLTLYGTTNNQDALAETKGFGNYYVDNYSLPHNRIEEIVFHPHMDEVSPSTRSSLWTFALQVDIGHIVEVHTIHPGGGGFAGVDFFVEGIHHEAHSLNEKMPWWEMKLDLSPRALYATYP